MKKTMMFAAMVLGAGLAALPALAQDAAPAGPPAGGHAGRQGNPMAAATADLNLTDDQQKTVMAAEADARTKMKALRDDTSTDQASKRKQMMQIQKDSMDKVRAVLTDDQKTKFDAKLAELRSQAKEKRDAAGAGAAPADGAMPSPPPPASTN